MHNRHAHKIRFFLNTSLLTLLLCLFVSHAFAQDEVATSTNTQSEETASEPPSRYNELKNNINSRTEDIKQLEREIAQYQTQLQVVGTQKKTLQSAVQSLDLSRAKLAKDIQLTQKKIENTSDTIADLNFGIKQKASKITTNRKATADILRTINQNDTVSLLEVILSKKTLSQFLEDVDDLNRAQIAIQDNIKSLEHLKSELGAQKNSHEVAQKKFIALNSQLADQKEIADQQRQEQNSLLKSTKNQESNYKKLLADKEARKKQFEQEIEDYEAQLRAEIDPNSFPRPGTKVLAYPLDNARITQHFGKTVDARRLYSSGTHNGIDFGVSLGTPVKSVADGVVVGTGDTDITCRGASYGKWVLIRHKNGLASLYGHLNLIKVKQGDSVESGDLIAYSGNTGYSTGPHLHFSVFVGSAVKVADLPSKSCAKAIFHLPVAPLNAYLDPESYL